MVPGGNVITLHGGKLTVRLKHPSNTLRVKLSGPLLVASKHAPKHPKLRISVQDAAGHKTQLTASL
jgi:hypothetical protein